MTEKQIQNLLQYLGYYTGAIDGIIGNGSKSAIRKFQADFGGIAVDGIVGLETAKALRFAVCNGIPEKKHEATGTFWDGINHFDRDEFRCKCGGKYCNGFPAEPQEKLIRTADAVREHFGNPVTVSSGVRCTKHNANVGGVSNSRHLSGKAMDFCVRGFSAASVLDYVTKQQNIRYAYAIDNQFVHMDIE